MIAVAKGVLGKLQTLSSWKWALLLTLLLSIYQIRVMHLDERLYFWIMTSLHQQQWQSRSLWLPQYRVTIDAKPVAGVNDNFTGLSYDSDRQQLWGVLNGPEQLLRLSPSGELLERYALEGFEDVEDVAYLGADLLLLAEERKHALVVLPVPVRGGSLQREGLRAITLNIGAGDNNGFEGLAYHRASDRLFVVKERNPRKLYEIRGLRRSLEGDLNLEIIDRQDWIDRVLFASDLSAVHFDERTGHLVLLSDESLLMVVLGVDGEVISFRSLLRGFAGLSGSVPQAEGLTFDPQGNLYLASEPNLFYRLERQ